MFATNGRPYLKQLETESGVRFRDTRHDTNLRRALSDWFTPDGLAAELQMDRKAAQKALETTPFDFGFLLRPYQKEAIETEQALAAERRAMLVAMATGTGKTKLSIAMLYRLLAAKRFGASALSWIAMLKETKLKENSPNQNCRPEDIRRYL